MYSRDNPSGADETPLEQQKQCYHDVTAEHLVEPTGDPNIAKWESEFWRYTGKMQAAVGNLSGIEAWKTHGRSTEAWADTALEEAEARAAQGDPSWINGKYNVLMGNLTHVVGYLAGDTEMQTRAQQRIQEGKHEISQSSL